MKWGLHGSQVVAWPTVQHCETCGEEHGTDSEREIVAHLPPDSPHGVLIVSAPRMLTALKAIRVLLESRQPIDPVGALMVARDAIAAVEGS